MLKPDIDYWISKSRLEQKEIYQFLKKNKKNKALDELFHKAHDEVFKKTDCLACANCCKTTSPIFRNPDIRRISKHLRMKESEFVNQYLKLDSDQDMVLKTAPCSFLAADNSCSIYENRPLACREYPHTNRKNMYQLLSLTQQNSMVCPAVSEIIFKIQK